MNSEILKQLRAQFEQDLTAAQSFGQLRDLEIAYLGRKQGKVTAMLRSLKDLSVGERKSIGPQVQQLKSEIVEALEKKNSDFKLHTSDFSIDVTLPGKKVPMGHYSPLTTMRRQVEDVFRSMGFMIYDGPELESEYYNFDSLNIPAWHPAREMWDTFYVENPKSEIRNPKLNVIARSEATKQSRTEKQNRLLLRTHTTNMQVRIMRSFPLPIRAIIPGNVYRNEATDARHEKEFTNVDGLLIAEGISLQHLTSVCRLFLQKILGEDVEIRFRPGYFPFTEPSLEIDISCTICKAKGCGVCKKTGWLEFSGAGMVHPNVLKAGGIDAKKYSGFAFGFGLDRLVMLKYGIDDVRLFRSQDLRFIQQF